MNLGCRCRCREWLRDVYGSVCAGPWWRLRWCRRRKGERLVATKKSFALWGLCWHRLWCVDVGENYIYHIYHCTYARCTYTGVRCRWRYLWWRHLCIYNCEWTRCIDAGAKIGTSTSVDMQVHRSSRLHLRFWMFWNFFIFRHSTVQIDAREAHLSRTNCASILKILLIWWAFRTPMRVGSSKNKGKNCHLVGLLMNPPRAKMHEWLVDRQELRSNCD